ncbi:polysaccharide deacetylase family protein [candidate division KSB1 bacterium]|nr:polysaccharide deacetylase family protein [candidate division KSB1 bacterium]
MRSKLCLPIDVAGVILFLVQTVGTLSGCRVADRAISSAPIISHGAIIRADTTRRQMALILTGGDYNDGGSHIRSVLRNKKVAASFFFTGDFYRNPANTELIRGLIADGHYLGPHSDQHLLYCDWSNRDSLLVKRNEFIADLEANYAAMADFGIERRKTRFFVPPYEWYNRTIARWAEEMDVVLINFTPGTRSNADYTTPDMPSYLSSADILESIHRYEKRSSAGLNGFILLLHIGTAPERTDKLYFHLEQLIDDLHDRGYRLMRIDRMLEP